MHPDARPDLLKKLCGTPVAVAVTRWDYFPALLGEPVAAVVAEFEARGLVRHSTLEERLAAGLTVARLKELLRARGASTRGKKADLLRELLKVERLEALEPFAAEPVFILTPAGQAEVERYLERRTRCRDAVREQIRIYVAEGKLRAAATVASAFHRAELFPPGINMDWSQPFLPRDVELLVESGHLEAAVANLMCDPIAEGDIDAVHEAACRRGLEELRHARAAGVKLAVVILQGRPCLICGGIPQRYSWEDLDAGRVPRLPLHAGCLCSYSSEVLE